MAFRLESSGSGGSSRIGANLSEINIIPLVDVILVLLLIFMLTAPLMHRGIDVALPKSSAKPTATEERLVLTLTKEQTIYLNDKPVPVAALEPRLRDAIKTRTDKTALPQGRSGALVRLRGRDHGPDPPRRSREARYGHGAGEGTLIATGVAREIPDASPMEVPRGRLGPALRRRRLPVAALTVSAVVHVVLAGGLLVAVIWGGLNARKVYVVNLVPSIAAVGAPTAPPAPTCRRDRRGGADRRASRSRPRRARRGRPSPRRRRASPRPRRPSAALPPRARRAAAPRREGAAAPGAARPSAARCRPAAPRTAETPREVARPAPPAPAGPGRRAR